MSASDGTRIFKRGPEVMLGGRKFHVRFGFLALHYIEQRFGSFGTFLERLGQKDWGPDRVRAVLVGLTAGLLHERPTDLSDAQFEEFVERALDGATAPFMAWINVMAEALDEQWPAPSGRTLPKGRGSRKGSRGRSSTSRRRSRSDAPKKSLRT